MKMNWSYVAGFFDGEGCIYWDRNSAKKHFGFALCNIAISQGGSDYPPAVLLEIKEFLSKHGIKSYFKHGRRGPNKHMYNLTLWGRNNVRNFLRLVLPFLYVKKAQTQDTLRFLILYPSLSGRKTQSKFDTEAMRTDAASGMSQRAIGKKHGLTQAAVSKRLLDGPKKFPSQMMFVN